MFEKVFNWFDFKSYLHYKKRAPEKALDVLDRLECDSSENSSNAISSLLCRALVSPESLAVILRVLKISWDTKGQENIPANCNYILAADHGINIDPAILRQIFPQKIYFIATSSIYSRYFIRPLLQEFGVIPVVRFMDREVVLERFPNASEDQIEQILLAQHRKRIDINKKALLLIYSLLNRGNSLGIFPSATFVEEKKNKLHSGVGHIAHHTRKPILPVSIINTNDVNPDWPYGAELEVRIGQLIHTDGMTNKNQITQLLTEKLAHLRTQN